MTVEKASKIVEEAAEVDATVEKETSTEPETEETPEEEEGAALVVDQLRKIAAGIVSNPLIMRLRLKFFTLQNELPIPTFSLHLFLVLLTFHRPLGLPARASRPTTPSQSGLVPIPITSFTP